MKPCKKANKGYHCSKYLPGNFKYVNSVLPTLSLPALFPFPEYSRGSVDCLGWNPIAAYSLCLSFFICTMVILILLPFELFGRLNELYF